MSARAEISNNAQSPQAEKSASKGMAVALIGPNDAHRQIVARALASSQGRKVHEFIDYPADLNDLPAMVEQTFDVVLVDVDTDESYALQIIERLAEIGQPVMAYSARTDQELLMSCMRAGARDFLPLPTEPAQPEQNRPEAASPQPAVKQAAAAAAVPPPAPRPVEPKAAPLPSAPVARAIVTPIVPEKHIEPSAEPWPTHIKEEYKAPEITQVIEEIPVNTASDASATEEPLSEFAAWDAANLRPAAAVAPPVRRPEARPRPALVPERRKTEPMPRPMPSQEVAPAAPIERPPVAVDLFRSPQVQKESEPDEAAEKRGANWVKWILIAAGPLVLALVLLLVFTRPSQQHAAAPPVKETPAPVQSVPQPSVAPVVTTPAKPVAGTLVAKVAPSPSPSAADASDDPNSAPVSPDAMAAQLVAPTRIAGQIKKPAPPEEPPPAAPGPVALEDSSVVPGAVFGNAGQAEGHASCRGNFRRCRRWDAYP